MFIRYRFSVHSENEPVILIAFFVEILSGYEYIIYFLHKLDSNLFSSYCLFSNIFNCVHTIITHRIVRIFHNSHAQNVEPFFSYEKSSFSFRTQSKRNINIIFSPPLILHKRFAVERIYRAF